MFGLSRKLVPLLDRFAVCKAKPTYSLFSTHTKVLSADTPKRYPHDAPERDLVNFPPPRMQVHPGKVRLGLFPTEWFDALYEKTGVTGPYILVWGSVATILSKEYFVYWVDTMEHIVFLGVFIFAAKKLFPKIAAYLDKEVDAENAKLSKNFQMGIEAINKQLLAIESEKGIPEVTKLLFEAKRENVGLQLEASYRERVRKVYEETKKRLDYHVAVQNAQQRVEKQEMLNFILGEANKAIGAKQENAFLQSCLGQLKTLAVKHANTI